MAQVIRSRLSAVKTAAALFIVPAKDYVLNRPLNPRLTDAYLAEVISSVHNMNNTGRLPSIGLVHLGMIIRLTNTVEAPEAVTDNTGEVVGIDLDPDEPSVVSEHASAIEGVRILHMLPTVTVKLHSVHTEFLPPVPCMLHAAIGARRDCTNCDFRAGCIAVEPQFSRRSRRGRPRFRHMVQDSSSETTVTNDDQNSKHNPYVTRRDDRTWLDIPLEIPTLLLGRTAMAGHIRCFIPATFSGTVDIRGNARRAA